MKCERTTSSRLRLRLAGVSFVKNAQAVNTVLGTQLPNIRFSAVLACWTAVQAPDLPVSSRAASPPKPLSPMFPSRNTPITCRFCDWAVFVNDVIHEQGHASVRGRRCRHMMRTKEVNGTISTPCSRRHRQMRAQSTFVPARDLVTDYQLRSRRYLVSGERLLFLG